MAWLIRLMLLACLMTAAACSMQGAIDRMSSPEERAFARGFVDALRSGKADRLKDSFDPELWEKSRPLFAKAQAAYPKGEGETLLISYNFESDFTAGTRKAEFVLSTTDGQRWTRTNLATWAQGGPPKIVAWNVEPFAEPPQDLRMFETMDRLLPWMQVGGLIVLLGVIALVWRLVRRSRRRRADG
jgi:hypothetical protein